MRATDRLASRSGIGMSTTAIFGFETSLGESSARFSATSSTTLSPFSISGRKDQRCSVTTAARSPSTWNAGSPAGAIVSAYSTTTAVRDDVTSRRSRAVSTRPFSVASSTSSVPMAGDFGIFAKRTPVERL